MKEGMFKKVGCKLLAVAVATTLALSIMPVFAEDEPVVYGGGALIRDAVHAVP